MRVNMIKIIRNPKILSLKSTAVLIIDIQKRIFDVMNNKNIVEENTIKLIKGAKSLNIPIYYTEQYPEGLGETLDSIKKEINDSEAIQKISFSCYGAGDLFNELKSKELSQIIVCGIESHVCVQQTVLDLVANGFQVNLAADAVSSRKKIDYKTSLRRMQFIGVQLTTVESILFELLDVCGTPQFKEILKIIK